MWTKDPFSFAPDPDPDLQHWVEGTVLGSESILGKLVKKKSNKYFNWYAFCNIVEIENSLM